MIVIPAIDIRKGNVVRLYRGLYNKVTVYSDDPYAIAQQWKDEGAHYLHIIDLDGAFFGKPKNLNLIEKIIREIDLKVHLGGGLRTQETINEVLSIGVHRVIMSTKIFEDESFLKNVDKEMKKKIIVSIDTKAGVVLDRGWTDQTSLTAVDAIAKVEKAGIESAVITDISRDGTLSGPNIDLLTKVLTATHINIIASGGIASIDDIQSLHSLETKHKNLFGAIIGKALYENKIKLAEAIACAQ